MAHPMTLPIVAGLTIAGAALGVHLGRSAIAEINPAYFSDPEVSFHADRAPYRSPDWAQVQVAEYQQAAAIEGLGTGCIGCRDYPVEYVPVQDPAVEGHADGWSASAAEPVQAVLYEEEEAPDPARARLERYSSYPITADEQETADAADADMTEEVYASTE